MLLTPLSQLPLGDLSFFAAVCQCDVIVYLTCITGKEVEADSVAVGTYLVVRPGSHIPIDAAVVSRIISQHNLEARIILSHIRSQPAAQRTGLGWGALLELTAAGHISPLCCRCTGSRRWTRAC